MSDWSAGRATFTTVPSMKAMLEPRMAATRTHRPRLPAACTEEEAARIAASSHGGLEAMTMAHSALALEAAEGGPASLPGSARIAPGRPCRSLKPPGDRCR